MEASHILMMVKKIAYNNDAGVKALTYLTDFEKTHKTTSNGFMNRGQDGFAETDLLERNSLP
jgi:hypothetical protein